MNEEKLLLDLVKMENWGISYGAYSRSTLTRATRRLKQLNKVIDLYDLSEIKLQEYVRDRLKKGATESALNHEFKDLRVWVKYKNLDIKLPKLKEARTKEAWIPTDEEMERIIKTVESGIDPSARRRSSCIIKILFFGGIRIGELIRLDVGDVLENGIYVISEKGEPPRIVGLPDDVLGEIKEYIDRYRANSDPKALFTTNKGRITYHYARKKIKEIGARAGVPKFHPHAARHKCATMLISGYRGSPPLDIRMVQIHLGHVSLSTTQQYTHIRSETVANVVREAWNNRKTNGKKRGNDPKDTFSNGADPLTNGAARIWTGVSGSQSP